MAGTYTKEKLSGSTDGLLIPVAGTARNAGTTVHQAGDGSDAGAKDEIWLYATNKNRASINLTIEWGNENAETAEITQSIPANNGLTLIIPGLILTNSEVVKAYVGDSVEFANKVLLAGFVNRVT
jgi:hypothetical protein